MRFSVTRRSRRSNKEPGVKFEYVPILLGGIFKATNNKSPAETLAGVKNKPEFHALETERFITGCSRSSPTPGIRSFRSTPSI